VDPVPGGSFDEVVNGLPACVRVREDAFLRGNELGGPGALQVGGRKGKQSVGEGEEKRARERTV
jgi:hypothetical protein